MEGVCVNHVTYFRSPETASDLRSNMDLDRESGVRLGRILCLERIVKNSPQLCPLGIFHLMPSSGSFWAIFEKSSAETDFRKLQILP